jgi:N-methylhydantoinase B/oxoprolinase/acetone carboxylase alpha subunit
MWERSMLDNIKQGDIFLNNCPYTGGTHHADMILSTPVFFRGAPLFWIVALSHHADKRRIASIR